MAAPKRLSVDARRAQLLDLGMRLFSERAYDELSTDEIAKAASISKGLLFHYFSSKRGFYVATIEEMARRVAEVTAPEPGLDLMETVRRSLLGYVRFVRSDGAIYRSLVRGGVGVDGQVHQILETVRGLSVQRVLEQMDVADPSETLRLSLVGWVGFCETVCLQWYDRPSLTEEALVQLLLDTLSALITRALEEA